MTPSLIEIVATVLFALAIIHTFSVKRFQVLAHRYPEGSIGENFFHLLGEIEVVFGIWAAFFLVFLALVNGSEGSIQYMESLNFTEPAFVFVIMVISSTRPVLYFAEKLIALTSQMLPIHKTVAFYFTALTVGPILGSFITEPAAMTVTALILFEKFYRQKPSAKFMYNTLALLFVNISIGGTLTHFAAPPVLMVASKWGWDMPFMFTHFGWKTIIVVTIQALVTTLFLKNELSKMVLEKEVNSKSQKKLALPKWIVSIHLLALALIVFLAHHPLVFMGVFLFFIGFLEVTKEYQEPMKLKEGLLVGFFLGGLVILGAPQRWWLEPLLSSLGTLPLYIGSAGLTAITDNAALTYLGAQVPSLSDASKYALVAGAVTGGGLTVIANAPNPAGYGILNPAFGKDGISPLGLFVSALPFTIFSLICYWFL